MESHRPSVYRALMLSSGHVPIAPLSKPMVASKVGVEASRLDPKECIYELDLKYRSDRLTQEILDAFNREHLTPHQARLLLARARPD